MNKYLDNQSEESFEKDLEQAVVRQKNSDLRSKYERILKETHGVSKGGNSIGKIYWIVGFILALVIAGIYSYQKNQKPEIQPQMYAVNLISDLKIKDNPAWDMRGGTTDQELSQIEAYKDVKAGNYESALNKYGQQKESLSKDSEYYQGLALMKLKRFDEAQMAFSKIAQGDNAYRQEAQWLLALAYIANEDFEKAKIQLQEIINKKEYNWSLASDLLNSILNQ